MKRFLQSSIVAIFIIAGYFVYQSGLIFDIQSFVPRKFPEFREPKTVNLSCNYRGTQLKIEETLYGSVYDFYKSDPKKKKYFYRDDNKSFVYSDPADKTIANLTEKIVDVAATKNLNSDQALDLAACFLQNIPYDEVKAKKILDPDFNKYPINEIIPRFPYETLYDNTGICTDKSYLGAAVFSKMGYGASLLSFDDERHLSIGVTVPADYVQYENYAIMELTGKGFLVGDLPMIKSSIGLAQNTIDSLPQISGENTGDDADLKTISKASKIEVVSEGKAYTRIAEREQLHAELESLKKQLVAKQQIVASSQQDLKQAESEVKNAENYYKNSPSRETYNTYSAIYNDYRATLARANADIASYNALVNKYNILVQKYKNY